MGRTGDRDAPLDDPELEAALQRAIKKTEK